MANQSDRVHDAIYDAINGFAFPRVSYDPDTGYRATSVTTEAPATVLVREQSARWEDSPNRRTPRLRDRSQWLWEATVRFDNQVSPEEFENSLADTPLFLPRTVELDQQVTVFLEESEVEHPPEQQPSSGTRMTFRFAAHVSRR